ncbi:hypothetical protein XELAEV_18003077mg [Xenopus laevis]|nr:hypothetical protein XELAEV_18003077mg [Xenopus laevis]
MESIKAFMAIKGKVNCRCTEGTLGRARWIEEQGNCMEPNRRRWQINHRHIEMDRGTAETSQRDKDKVAD